VIIVVSITIPAKMGEEIDGFIKEGYYDNRSELIREAIRMFLTHRSKQRLVVAIRMYKDEEITISRAAEIAGIAFEQMKNILIDEGVFRRGLESESNDTSHLEAMIEKRKKKG
jgi:metal-responsive CopG/Arc/MetJ family transcriptional regulator